MSTLRIKNINGTWDKIPILGSAAAVVEAKAQADRAKSEADRAASEAGKFVAGTYYTKTETNSLLSGKADNSTTYTKTETNNLLSNKANSSDLNSKADKSSTYTKNEIDTSLAGYLLLTGGNMTGNLTFGDFAFKPFGTHIDIGYDWDAKKGAGIAFRGSNWNSGDDTGGFDIYARNGDGDTSHLVGYPNGKLVWNGKEVSDYVTEIYQSGGYWYRLYRSGWLEQGGVFDNGSNARSVDGWINWAMPFKDLNYTVFLTPEREGTGNRCMAFGFNEKAVDKIHVNAYGPGSSSDMCRYIQAFACGYAY